jgi:hypothetical protein
MIMSSNIQVHPIEVRGTKHHVTVDESGDWCATVGKETLRSKTRSGLVDKLRELTAKAAVTIEIPFLLVNGGSRGDRPARGVVTGIHSGNGNMLIRWTTGWQAGKSQQWSPSYSDVIFDGAIPDEDVEKRSVLAEAKRVATAELYDFDRLRTIQLRDLAVAAIDRAVRDGNA